MIFYAEPRRAGKERCCGQDHSFQSGWPTIRCNSKTRQSTCMHASASPRHSGPVLLLCGRVAPDRNEGFQQQTY